MDKCIKISSTGEQLADDAPEWSAVLDFAPNLMWESNISNKRYGYDQLKKRISEVNKIGLCGYKDWRLPDVDELKVLASNMGKINENIQYFPYQIHMEYSYFWSLTQDPSRLDCAWMVDFDRGVDLCFKKIQPALVRLVRNNIPKKEISKEVDFMFKSKIVNDGYVSDYATKDEIFDLIIDINKQSAKKIKSLQSEIENIDISKNNIVEKLLKLAKDRK